MSNQKIITRSNEEFTSTICEIIRNESLLSIKKRGRFSLVLSGGNTPGAIFDKLAESYKNSIEWEKVDLFWLDERDVPSNDRNSNFFLAKERLVDKIEKIGSINNIKVELGAKCCVDNYKETIQKYFVNNKTDAFDIILIGIGHDGHLASIFPNSREFQRKGESVMYTDQSYYGFRRYTLGLNLINKSRCKLIMASDSEKVKIIESKDKFLPICNIEDSLLVAKSISL